jgi:HK97 family phage major capsid protein/HK97 family phage prohead protease
LTGRGWQMPEGKKLRAQIETPVMRRDMTLERGTINDEKRTVELSFSSELPVERWFGYEILDHTKDSVDLSRLNGGGALLVDHDTRDQVGVVEAANITDRKGKATVRFGQSARAKEIFTDVKDGIRTLVSVGYRIRKMVTDKIDEGVETLRAVDWMPYEISLVSVPADPSVGVGRAGDFKPQFLTLIESSETEHKTMKRNILFDAAPAATSPAGGGGAASSATTAAAAATPAAGTRTAADERRIMGEMLAIGRQFDAMKEAEQFIADGKTPEELRKHILENKFSAKPLKTSPDVGMSRTEVKRWSLVRGLRMISNKKPVDGLEREVNEEMEKLCGRSTEGIYIPNEVVHGHPDDRMRDLAATGGGPTGGYTVQTDVLGGSLIELLRNMMITFSLGARKLGGLVGNVAIPSQSGGATAYWVAENAQTTSSNPTFGQIGLTPHRLSAVTALGKMLLAQSSVDVEGLVREDLARVLAIAIDLAALAGAGNNDEPLGIVNTPGVGSVSFGAAATWAKILDFETQVSNANALLGNLAYASTPATRAKLKAAAKIGSTFPVFMWEKGAAPGEGEINSYRAVATKQIAGDLMIFGNWSDLIIADWIGMDVVVDPYTLADKHQVKTTINMLADVAVRHLGSFAVSSDSAAQ